MGLFYNSMIDKVYEEFTIEERSVFPEESFFNNSFQRSLLEKKEREVKNSSNDTLILGDADADGLCAAVVIRNSMNEKSPYVPCGYNGTPLDLRDGFKIASDFSGDEIIIEDICPDNLENLKKLEDLSDKFTIKWFDHHKWDENIYDFVERNSEVLIVDDTEDKPDQNIYEARCTAQIARDYYGDKVDEHIDELADVVAEYDLWRLRDDRAPSLTYYALSDNISYEEYLNNVEKFGPEIEENIEAKNAIEDYKEKKRKLKKMALDRAEFIYNNGLKIGFIYGECRQSEISETLRKEENCNLIVVLKPSGYGSLRGSEEFKKCHILADKLGGGGHPKASGFHMDIEDSNKLVDMWYNNGGQVLDDLKNIVTDYVKDFK